MVLCASIIMGFRAVKPEEVWTVLQRSHPQLLAGSRACWLYDTKCTLDDVASYIAEKEKPHFAVSLSERVLPELSYGHVRNHALSRVEIRGLVASVDDGEEWVRPFLREGEFRQAWLYDAEYQRFQNAEDPSEYITAGRNCSGLPMKSNGLPYPLDRQIIDTSHNPGRCRLRDGYVEAVGAAVWLGEQFWPLTGASKQAVLAADWLQCGQPANGVLRVQAADAPFTTAEGASGSWQDRLRSLLFPESH